MQLNFQKKICLQTKQNYMYCNADITQVHTDVNNSTTNGNKRKNYRLTADQKYITK